MAAAIAGCGLCTVRCPAPRPSRRGQRRLATSSPVLLKASDYLAGYVKALSSVVSEERYDQVVVRKGDRNAAGLSLYRTLLSDYLLVARCGLGRLAAVP